MNGYRYCRCGNPISKMASSGRKIPPAKYAKRKTCGRPACVEMEKRRHRLIEEPKRRCPICKKTFTRAFKESLQAFNNRKSCGSVICDGEVRRIAKEKARAKNAIWYRVEPDAAERFCFPGV